MKLPTSTPYIGPEPDLTGLKKMLSTPAEASRDTQPERGTPEHLHKVCTEAYQAISGPSLSTEAEFSLNTETSTSTHALPTKARVPEAMIARWKWMDNEDGACYMERCATGGWVTYEDHVKAVLAARASVQDGRGSK